ncbi:DUF5723 family protein [Ferruginibacter lapsinanis]|uniref:DUF5723 family protein n=1 Tax=Ferruginibacter lapsinanis TaxID=563172 RepID=UPI001E52859A|nr:DUF5723 family protein [Ferruginibacter lapsinanis]UEG49687.1 DUF5723 family protein [Ferruginibacter lapsinanis]
MRKILLFIALITLHVISFAQSFPGYISGNYIGVNSVFSNPANIADSRYRWDVNLVSVHAGLGNNNASFKIDNIGDAFGKNIDSVLFGSSAKKTNAMANIDVFGPSFMFNAGPKTSVAITTRVRTLANIKDIDGQLIKSIDDNLEGSLPLTLSSDANQKIVVNGWADFGLTLAHVLYSDKHHFLKGGITGKYLAGVANTYANIANFKGTADEDLLGDTYIRDASGAVAIGISGVDIDNFEANDLTKFKSSGFGADLGFVYEYRPYGDAATAKYPNKYKYKVAVSLMDMGSIKYTPDANKTGAYSVSISGGQKWYPSDLDGKSIEEIKTYLDGSPYFTNLGTAASSYKASLPTNLQASVDYNIHKNLFVGLSTQLNVAKKDNKYASYYNNSVTLTPRYEGRKFGLYIPLNYNELTNFNAGLSLRIGPLFFGSGSILTALMDKSKQADVHFGIRFGGLKKKNLTAVKTTVVEQTVYKTKKHKAKNDNNASNSNDVKAPLAKEEKAAVIAVVDTDGDGINDDVDSCKTVMGVIKYNGCPVPDTDGDGVNDDMDSCKTIAGLARYNGCTIPDTDGDGVNDEEDQCKTVAGVAKYKGCPIPDTDGDGVNDEEDKCPGLVGDRDNFGCPQLKKGAKKPAAAASEPAVKKDLIKKVNIAAKGLQFATGKSVILKKSYAALNNVVKVLKADPSLQLSIEGHTDSVGNADKNMQLSIDRANAAKAYFVKKGIDESRITAEGFGAEKPIASNKTAAGRLKNRRVVFTLTK